MLEQVSDRGVDYICCAANDIYSYFALGAHRDAQDSSVRSWPAQSHGGQPIGIQNAVDRGERRATTIQWSRHEPRALLVCAIR